MGALGVGTPATQSHPQLTESRRLTWRAHARGLFDKARGLFDKWEPCSSSARHSQGDGGSWPGACSIGGSYERWDARHAKPRTVDGVTASDWKPAATGVVTSSGSSGGSRRPEEGGREPGGHGRGCLVPPARPPGRGTRWTAAAQSRPRRTCLKTSIIPKLHGTEAHLVRQMMNIEGGITPEILSK